MQVVVPSNEDLLRKIREKDREAILMIYREMLPVIRNLVKQNSGCDEDAEDVFQDAMVILYRRLRNDHLVLKCKLTTFIYAICKNLWFQRINKMKIKETTDFDIELKLDEQLTDLDEDYMTEMVMYNLLQKHMLKLSRDCREILTLFYNKTSLADIAEKLGLSSPEYAKFRKFQCKENLKKRVLNDPQLKMFYTHGK